MVRRRNDRRLPARRHGPSIAAMRSVFALLLVMIAPAATAAGQDPTPTAADVLSIGTDIPGRMTVPVTIGSSGPFPFTIDTGAERTVISRELAQLLNLQPGPGIRITAMTGTSSVGTVQINALAVSSAGRARIEAPLLEGRNLGAPGLLGIDSLQGHAVSINFDTQRMAVTSSRRARMTGEPDDVVVRARSLHGQLVITDAYFNGTRVRVVLDTGSVVSMGNLALKAKLGRRVAFSPISVVSVTGQALKADYARIGDVHLGGVIFQDLPVAFADAAPFQRLGLDKKPALLLGMDALRQFRRVDIDFANRELRLALPRPANG